MHLTMGLSSQDMVTSKRINSTFQVVVNGRRRCLRDLDFGAVVINKQTINSRAQVLKS